MLVLVLTLLNLCPGFPLISNDINMAYDGHSGTSEPKGREKGSGKRQNITLETYVGSVHIQGPGGK